MNEVHSLAIIDDEPEMVDMLSEALTDNFVVNKFPSADAVVEQIQAGASYDIYLTDISMPGTNGIEFLKWLRLKDIMAPVIVITGFAEKENAMQAIEHGSFAMIEKSFHFGNVFAIVNRASAYLLLQEITDELLIRYSELIETFDKQKERLSKIYNRLKQH